MIVPRPLKAAARPAIGRATSSSANAPGLCSSCMSVSHGVTLAARLTGKTAAETISAMLAVFGRIDPHLRRSITFDNDTAFAQHGLLRTMRDMTTWFCDAYASWQKGGIENANRRLRRWLPRHLDIDRTSDQDIQEIVLTTNLTPCNASGSRRRSKPCLPSLERTFKSASLEARCASPRNSGRVFSRRDWRCSHPQIGTSLRTEEPR